jgi:hypothetical protein
MSLPLAAGLASITPSLDHTVAFDPPIACVTLAAFPGRIQMPNIIP